MPSRLPPTRRKTGAEGPAWAVESVFTKGKKIGVTWAVLDYDDIADESRKGF